MEARPSKVPGANDGLFAKVAIEPNTVLAFYNGRRIKPRSKDDWDHSDWEKVCRSEEHTSELQSLVNLVCRLLLEKKK